MRDNSKVVRSLSMITQFTIHMLVPICMCSYGGYLLDKKFGTSLLIKHKTDEKGDFRQSECLIGDF